MGLTSRALRGAIYACHAEADAERTYSRSPSVVHRPSEDGHGNFLPASYARIVKNPAWSSRLAKTYTASARLPRAQDRSRGELECANSSDALLMNVFCYPRVTHRAAVARLLGIAPGVAPEFGVRAHLTMRNDEVDRTEIDMMLGDLVVEAKLTETAFTPAARARAERYLALDEVFDADELPWGPRGLSGYQLVRGVLAAHRRDARFVLMCDGRRSDLQETFVRVARAVRSSEMRSRLAVLHWQELAAALPASLRTFLREHYGIMWPRTINVSSPFEINGSN